MRVKYLHPHYFSFSYFISIDFYLFFQQYYINTKNIVIEFRISKKNINNNNVQLKNKNKMKKEF